MRRPRIVVSGIGTGGHYFPALVTARELQRRGFEVRFLVRRGGPEESIARGHGLAVFPIAPRPYYGRSLAGKLLSVPALIRSILRLNPLVRPGAGLSFGGFGAVPLNISCLLNRRPFYIFEPNRVPGRATRVFASRARRVFLGMGVATPLAGKTVLTGIPIRDEFAATQRRPDRQQARRRVEILFYGGSQGARRLNDLALDMQDHLPQGWQLTVIAGTRDHERVSRMKKGRTQVVPFTARPWEEIARADVIVSRAGALAGYEIMALDKRTIFIPFPHAVDAHQQHNAQYFAEVGNALVADEDGLTAERLRSMIGELLTMRRRGRTVLAPNAARVIAGFLAKDFENEKV